MGLGHGSPAGLVPALGVVVSTMFIAYGLGGWLLGRIYSTGRAAERADNVRFVIVSVASESVRTALLETISRTSRRFPDYPLYSVIDEGSALQPELEGRDDVVSVVVPDAFECDARAKGRAIQYFVQEHVENGYWYAFLDDDNIILDDEFLYEIPYYEERGYAATNPVLVPREGRSVTTYIADYIRYFDDLTVFRVVTGLIGRPYIGLHGELLCSRGAVLKEVGFDRPTMVEDFGFAMGLIENGWKTWQSRTRVSILSPHTITAFYKQRRRWFIGILRYLPRAPRVTKALVGGRAVLWSMGLSGNWILLPLWLGTAGLEGAFHHWTTVGAGVLYATICFVGIWKLGLVKGVLAPVLIPVCSFMEHSVPVFAFLRPNTEFVVIEK